MRSKVDVSFVVPYVELDHLVERTIRGIKAQKTSLTVEVILVNNGPGATPAMDGVLSLRCEKPGAGSARNFGAKEARGRFLAFVDSDVILDENWVEECYAEITKSPRIAAVQTPVVTSSLNEASPSFLDRFRYVYKESITRGSFVFLNKDNIIINTAACLLNREVFWFVGGFEEGLLRAEDRHLTLKLLAKGYFLSCTMKTSSKVYNTKGLLKFAWKFHRQGRDDRRINEALGVAEVKKPRALNSSSVLYRTYRRLCLFFFSLGYAKFEDPIAPVSFGPSLLNPLLGLAPSTLVIRGAEELILINTKSQQVVTFPLKEFDWKFPLTFGGQLQASMKEQGFIL